MRWEINAATGIERAAGRGGRHRPQESGSCGRCHARRGKLGREVYGAPLRDTTAFPHCSTRRLYFDDGQNRRGLRVRLVPAEPNEPGGR